MNYKEQYNSLSEAEKAQMRRLAFDVMCWSRETFYIKLKTERELLKPREAQFFEDYINNLIHINDEHNGQDNNLPEELD